MPDIGQWSIQLVSSAIVAIIVVRLSLRKFYSQKWWEKQAEVYSEILEALSDLQISNDDDYRRWSGESDEPKGKTQKERHKEANERIRKISTIGVFIVSQEVQDHLSALRKGVAIGSETDVVKLLARRSNEYQKAIKEISKCARRDLELDHCWWKLW